MSHILRAVGSFIWSDPVETDVNNEKKKEKKGKKESVEVEIDQIPPKERLVDDCVGCNEPCSEHNQYPSYLEFDTETTLLGTMKPYGRHIMISTHKSDWAEHIEDEKGSIAAHLSQLMNKQTLDWRTFVTNTSLPSTYSTIRDSHDILILPDNIMVSNVTTNDIQLFYDMFVKRRLPEGPVTVKSFEPIQSRTLKVVPIPYKSMILICSHKKRDKRCGITAPILYHEFDNVLREKDDTDTVIMMVSHVGGHKYAGNVICYINHGETGIWYGRVKACHCKEIVEQTIQKGKVIKELYRGAMSNSYGSNTCNRIKW